MFLIGILRKSCCQFSFTNITDIEYSYLLLFRNIVKTKTEKDAKNCFLAAFRCILLKRSSRMKVVQFCFTVVAESIKQCRLLHCFQNC
jgi:hypothetical protein